MTSRDPVVSVVMPAYNGAALIGETLASLGAQTMGDFEVIVVDDCSKDDTRDLVANWPDPRVRLIALEENGGPVRARNRAVAEARGRYIAGLDQDDLCHPDRFARQVTAMEADASIALLGTNADMLADGKVRPSGYPVVTTPALIAWLARIENPLVWSSVMVRGDVARSLAPFTRPEILYAEDFDLYHRVQRHGRLARLDAPLLTYRQHGGGASKRFTDMMQDSAARVLAGCYAPVFGDDAAAIAALVVRHNMEGEPVPDRATLATLGRAMARLQHFFLGEQPHDAQSLRLIRWETARRWSRLGRSGLRAGTISMADVVACRPDHLGLGYAGVETLAWSRAIGSGRKLAERMRRRRHTSC